MKIFFIALILVLCYIMHTNGMLWPYVLMFAVVGGLLTQVVLHDTEKKE